MSKSHVQASSSRSHRVVLLAAVGAMSAGSLLAACGSAHNASSTSSSSPPSSGSSSGSSSSSSSSPSASSGGLASITSKLQASANTSYDATYTVSGGANATKSIELASSPPDKVVFIITDANGTKTELISAGQLSDSCTQSGATWNCVQYPQATFASLATALQIYRGGYWTQVLTRMQAAAAASGVTVTPSTMSAAGQQLACVTYTGGSVGAGGEVCVTSDGVLGYVHSATSNVTFQLSSYSTSPSPSVFGLPAGATITTVP